VRPFERAKNPGRYPTRLRLNPKCSPERAGLIPGALQGSVSASAAARQEKHFAIADFIDAAAAGAQ